MNRFGSRQFLSRALISLAVGVFIASNLPSIDAAQVTVEGSPVPVSQCVRAPRSPSIEDVIFSTKTPGPSAIPTPVTTSPLVDRGISLKSVPKGEAVDSATLVEITKTLTELTACFNARDDDRAGSYFSDGFYLRYSTIFHSSTSGGDATPISGFAYDSFTFGSNAAVPAIQMASTLPDHRVIVLLQPKDSSMMALIWINQSGVWLIDEQAYILDEATPIP